VTEPDRVLPLLWRHASPSPEVAAPRRGPRQKLTVDDVVDAAIEIADRDGLTALAMRGLAQHLGIGAMSLYTYVPNRTDLIVLMVDQVLGRTVLPAHPDGLRERLELVARVQYEDCRNHPWLLEVSGLRAWLGPHVADRYEWQLAAVEGSGLDDIEMDQTVTLLASFGTSIARAEQAVRQAERESGVTDATWWEANYEALGEVMAGREYPLAGRVGTAAGEAYQAASDPRRELDFGLARIVDGLLAYLADRQRPGADGR
jgi:AcrR family transcriptional regulator